MQEFIEELNQKLNNLKKESSFREIKNIKEKFSKYIVIEDKKMLNLSSNDYLNISTDRDLILEFIEKYKNDPEFLFSSASARLLTGSSSVYKKLETLFCAKFQNKYKDKKDVSSLLFNTGYQCNQGVISALFNRGDCIFCDKLNHASIISGLKLSPAEHFRYKHLDYDNLEKLLKEKRKNYKNAIIISESVFSMDGDIADIKKLIELKKKYNCLLMIDEAHAFLVFGDNLLGIGENYLNDIDIITLTLGKALGSTGAIAISNKTIIDYLINKASTFIFSTALPGADIMWSYFLLNEKFDLLKEKKEKLTALFKSFNFKSQIVPIIIGEADKTQKLAHIAQESGFFVSAINPPTVPVGTSRLRISLTSDITKEEIERFFKVIGYEF